MIIKDLLTENIYTETAPGYIKSYPKFYKLIKMISNYILSISNTITQLILWTDVRIAVENNIGRVLLEELANKFYVYFNKNTVNKESYEQEEYLDILYHQMMYAIEGKSLQRTSDGAVKTTEDAFYRIFGEDVASTINIIDRAILTDVTRKTIMSGEVDLVGTSEILNSSVISKYMLPNLCGVNWDSQYSLLSKQSFAYDRYAVHIKNVSGTNYWFVRTYVTDNITDFSDVNTNLSVTNNYSDRKIAHANKFYLVLYKGFWCEVQEVAQGTEGVDIIVSNNKYYRVLKTSNIRTDNLYYDGYDIGEWIKILTQ